MYFRYLRKTNTTMFTILSGIKWAKFYLSDTIITHVSLFDHVIYSSADTLLAAE